MIVNLTSKAKKYYDENTKSVLIGATVVAIVGAAYCLGRSHGEMNVDIFLKPAPDKDYIKLVKHVR